MYLQCLFWLFSMGNWFLHVWFWVLFHCPAGIRRNIVWWVRLRKSSFFIPALIVTWIFLIHQPFQNIRLVHIANTQWGVVIFYFFFYLIILTLFRTYIHMARCRIFLLEVIFWKRSRFLKVLRRNHGFGKSFIFKLIYRWEIRNFRMF